MMTPKQKREALGLITVAALVALFFAAPKFVAGVVHDGAKSAVTPLFKQLAPAAPKLTPPGAAPDSGPLASLGGQILQPIAVGSAIANAQRIALDPAGYVLANRSEQCLSLVRRINSASEGLPPSVAGWEEGKRRRSTVVAEGAASGCFTKAPLAIARDSYTTELYKAKRSKMAQTPPCDELASQADGFYNDPKTNAITKGQWLERVFAVAAAKGCLKP